MTGVWRTQCHGRCVEGTKSYDRYVEGTESVQVCGGHNVMARVWSVKKVMTGV